MPEPMPGAFEVLSESDQETFGDVLVSIPPPSWKLVAAIAFALALAITWINSDLHICYEQQTIVKPNSQSSVFTLEHTTTPITKCGFKPSHFNFLAAESRNWPVGLSLPDKDDEVWETHEGKELLNKRRRELLDFWDERNAGVKGTGLEEWHHASILREIKGMLRDAEDWVERKSYKRDVDEFHESQEKRFARFRDK
jgi:hypothetical protein